LNQALENQHQQHKKTTVTSAGVSQQYEQNIPSAPNRFASAIIGSSLEESIRAVLAAATSQFIVTSLEPLPWRAVN